MALTKFHPRSIALAQRLQALLDEDLEECRKARDQDPDDKSLGWDEDIAPQIEALAMILVASTHAFDEGVKRDLAWLRFHEAVMLAKKKTKRPA